MTDKLAKKDEVKAVAVEVLEKATIPETTDEYTAPAPDDKKTCLILIAESATRARAEGVSRYWYIGKLVAALSDREEKQVAKAAIIEEVMQKTKFEKRTVQYAESVFRKFPQYKLLEEATKAGVEWSDYKELIKIQDDKKRIQVLKQLTSGEVKREDLKEKIESTKAVERPPLDLPEPGKDSPTPCKFYTKIYNFISKTRTKLSDLTVDVDDYSVIMSSKEAGVALAEDVFIASSEALMSARDEVADLQSDLLNLEEKLSKLIKAEVADDGK